MTTARVPHTIAGLKAPPWVIPGLIREKTLTLITAPAHTGKSILALNIAMAAASGHEILGSKPTNQRNVLFCAWDAPKWDYAGIIRKLARGLGVVADTYPGLTPEIMDQHPLWPMAIMWDRVGIEGNNGRDFYVAAHRIFEHPLEHDPSPQLIIFDTCREAHSADEQDNTAMADIMRLFKRLASEVPVVMLHHPPHSEPGRARGASVIEGSIDAHLVLSKSTELKTITATWRKNRGGDLPELFKYKQLEDFDPRGKPRIKLKINLEYPLIK